MVVVVAAEAAVTGDAFGYDRIKPCLTAEPFATRISREIARTGKLVVARKHLD